MSLSLTLRITARRRTGHAVVMVQRGTNLTRTHRVSLARYAALRAQLFDRVCAASSALCPLAGRLRLGACWERSGFELSLVEDAQ